MKVLFHDFQNNVMNYKTKLMGWSIIFIVLCHTSGLEITGLQVLSPGMMGADFFILLSGYSLGYSYNKYTLGRFYLRRLARIYPMYLVLTLMGCVIVSLFKSPMTVDEWLASTACLPYYEVRGGYISDWYLSISFALYFIFPLLYRLPSKTMLVGLCLMALVLQYLYAIDIIHINTLLARGLASIPMFCWGIFLYKSKDTIDIRKWNLLWLVLIALTVLLNVKGVHLHFFWITDIIAPICILSLYWLVKRSNGKEKLNAIIDVIGIHSLEIYIANLTTLRLVESMNSTIIVEALIYIVGTLLLSVVCISLNTKIQYYIHLLEMKLFAITSNNGN